MMPGPFASVGKAGNDAGAEKTRGADLAIGTKAVMTMLGLGQPRRLAGGVLVLRGRFNACASALLRGGLA